MAIEDFLPNIFGRAPTMYQGLLNPKDQAALESRANLGGLLGAGAALAQGMSPQGYSRSPLQNVLTALAAGYSGAGQTYESGINQMANVMKLQQSKRQLQGLQELAIKNPDLAYLAAVSPEEFVKQVSARQRMQMYGLGGTPSQAAPAPSPAPSPSPSLVSAQPAESVGGITLKQPTKDIGFTLGKDGQLESMVGGLAGGLTPTVGLTAQPQIEMKDLIGLRGRGEMLPVTTQPEPAPAAVAPAAPAPAPAATNIQQQTPYFAGVSPENKANAENLRQRAALAEMNGDAGFAKLLQDRAERLDPKEQVFFRDGKAFSTTRGLIADVSGKRILNDAEATSMGLDPRLGKWQISDNIPALIPNTGVSPEQRKSQLIASLPTQLANVHPTLKTQASALMARAESLTDKDINSELEKILQSNSEILGQLNPQLQAAKKSSAPQVNVYPPGAVAPGKEGANKVDAQLLELGQNRLNLQSIATNFNPKYLEKPFQLKMEAIAAMEKFGKKPSPEQAAELAEYSEFAQNAYNQLNGYINLITGAAVGSGEEEARIRKGVPDPQRDSPTQFLSKLNAKLREGRLYEARLGYIKQNGLKMTDVDVNKIPTLMRQREAALKGDNKLFGGKNYSDKDPNHKAIVRAILSREFGLME